MARTGYIEGDDIMVYVDTTGAGTAYQPMAAATNHKISDKAETKTSKRKTKDANASMWDKKTVSGLSRTITVNGLTTVVEGSDAKYGYYAMLTAMHKGDAVKVKNSFSTEQTGDVLQEGMYVITSCELDTPTGQDATWSATLESTGEITTKKK